MALSIQMYVYVYLYEYEWKSFKKFNIIRIRRQTSANVCHFIPFNIFGVIIFINFHSLFGLIMSCNNSCVFFL